MATEQIYLGDSELKYYAELFTTYDVENSGKISGPNASELFITSGLSHETLFEVELYKASMIGIWLF